MTSFQLFDESVHMITRSTATMEPTTSSQTQNQTVNDGVAHSKNPKKCTYQTWPLILTLTLSTPWMHADLESIVCKSGGDPAICLREEAICAKVYRRTDGRTDDGRHAIALAHSWNELKTVVFFLQIVLKCISRQSSLFNVLLNSFTWTTDKMQSGISIKLSHFYPTMRQCM